MQNDRTIGVALAVIAYDTLGESAATLELDTRGRAMLPSTRPVGTTRILVAAAPQVPRIHRWVNRFVVASNLLASTGIAPNDVRHVNVRLANEPAVAPVRVKLDEAFSLRDDARQLPTKSNTLALNYEIVLSSGGVVQAKSNTPIVDAPETDNRVLAMASQTTRQRAHSPGALRVPRAAASTAYAIADDRAEVLHEQCIPGIECYDMAPVTASISFRDELAAVNLRIYPAEGSVTRAADGTLHAQLRRPLVAVDGFDLQNSLTQEDFWVRFGFGIQRFVALGYDVITIDYVNGRDYIERNGYAIREFLNSRLPLWNESGDAVALVAGSMGTQTTRWALTTAERDGENHNVGLFVALDGTFRGANIPISIQAAVDFVAGDLDEAAALREGLDSPAARQQLRNTRFTRDGVKYWYQPHPDRVSLTEKTDELGMPRQSRNVGFANGSGTGSRISDELVATLVNIDFSKLFSAVKIKTKTDHNGEVFKGRIRKFIFNSRGSLKLNRSFFLDRAAGGTRDTPREIKEVAEAADFDGVSIGLETHGFVPTFSGLGINTSNADYIAIWDPNIYGKSNFDAVYWEKCNTGHVEFTPGILGMLFEELVAFKDNRPAQDLERYQTACGIPEPMDLCIAPAIWLGGASLSYIVPNNDGANCYVSRAPGGRPGFVKNNRYYIDVESGASCYAGNPLDVEDYGPACLVGVAPEGMTGFFYQGAFYYDGYD